MKTAMTEDVPPGALRMPTVDSPEKLRASGFEVGRRVLINPGGATEEEGIIAELGSIVLLAPTRFVHKQGESIALVPEPTQPGHPHHHNHHHRGRHSSEGGQNREELLRRVCPGMPCT